MKKIKVMHVVTSISDEFAGPSYSVPSLCSALTRNGCDVTLYTLDEIPNKNYNFEVKTFKRSSLPTLRIAHTLGRSKTMLDSMLRDVSNFDVVHSHMLWKGPNYYSGFAALKENKPFLIAPRGTMSEWALAYSSWKKKIVLSIGQKKALDAVTCFHATSEDERNDISKYGYSNRPCAILPNGVDIPILMPKQEKALKRLVFLSRIHEKKGVDILIRAWSVLQNRFKGWELAIVGPDDHEYAIRMKNLAEELTCERLKFTGPIYGQDKVNYLQNSDLFVLPTHSENFGMVVAEALACEVPVICSKGAPWEGLQSHDAGWWIDIGEKPLVKTLEDALSLDIRVLEKMGKNGREWVRDDFSWDSIAKQTIEVYKWLINENIKPQCVV